MRTYAEYLNTMTVKALNAIARDMGLKGYSKLRKVALISFIDDAIVTDCVDRSADFLYFAQFGEWPGEVKAPVAPVAFSEAPSKAPESPVETTAEVEAESDTAEDLIYAYRQMRATYRKARGMTQIKIGARLRSLSATLKIMGVRAAVL